MYVHSIVSEYIYIAPCYIVYNTYVSVAGMSKIYSGLL